MLVSDDAGNFSDSCMQDAIYAHLLNEFYTYLVIFVVSKINIVIKFHLSFELYFKFDIR